MDPQASEGERRELAKRIASLEKRTNGLVRRLAAAVEEEESLAGTLRALHDIQTGPELHYDPDLLTL